MASAQTAPVCEAVGTGVCYYISPTGLDSNPGTYALPWKSFANLISYYSTASRPSGWKALKAGDYMYVMGGIHNTVVNPGGPTGPQGGTASIAYFRNLGGTPSNPIRLKAYPGTNPIFDGAATGITITQTPGYASGTSSASGWAVSGIEIRNATGPGVHLPEATNVELSYLFIHDNSRGVQEGNPTGLYLTGAGAIRVHHCTFQDNMEIPAIRQVRGTGTHIMDSHGDITMHDNVYANTKFITPGVQVFVNPTTNPTGVKTELAGKQGMIIGGPQNDAYYKYWQIRWDDGISGWTPDNSLTALTTYAINNRVAARSDLTGNERPLCLNYKHAALNLAAKFEIYNNRFDNCGLIVSGTQNTHFYRNVVTNGAGFSSSDQGGVTHQVNMLVEYNTFFNTSRFYFVPTIAYRNTSPNDPSNIVFRNNILYGSAAAKIDVGPFIDDALFNITRPAMSFAQNCYFSPAASPTFAFGDRNGGAYGTLGGTYSLAQWQSTYGYDSTSKIADPLFVNAAGGNFNLASGSPCANMGASAAGATLPPPTDALPPAKPKNLRAQ